MIRKRQESSRSSPLKDDSAATTSEPEKTEPSGHETSTLLVGSANSSRKYTPIVVLAIIGILVNICILKWHAVTSVGTCSRSSFFLGLTSCPNGNLETHIDFKWWGLWETRYCCDPNTEGFMQMNSSATNCRLTSCQSISPSTNHICSTLEPRFISNGRTQLDYEEVLRESCDMDGGSNKVTVECCVKNSVQSYLASVMGAEPHEFPHMAKVRSEKSQCGGTIYNKRFVITAAHCVFDNEKKMPIKPGTVKLILGSNLGEMASPDNIYFVKRIISHPQYGKVNGDHNLNDIALLELEKDIRFGNNVKAIQIAQEKFDPLKFAGRAVRVGWGQTVFTNDSSVHLHKANLRIKSDSFCFEEWHYPQDVESLREQLICLVGGDTDNGTTSPVAGPGDSGGPAICRGADGRAILCGIASTWQGGCPRDYCRHNFYVKIAFFHKWIKQHAGVQDPDTLHRPFLFGRTVPEEKYLHQVRIMPPNGKPCAGSLVARDIVLTTAECGKNSEDKGYLISASDGNHYLISRGKPFYHVVAIKRGDYADDKHNHELILLKLDGLFDVSPNQLPTLPEDDFSPSYGMEMELPSGVISQTSVMKTRDLKFINREECQIRRNRLRRLKKDFEPTVQDNIICGVETYSGGASCDRELGGGVMCKGENGRDVLCGIQTFRYCDSSIPNLYINVALYADWIKQAMKEM